MGKIKFNGIEFETDILYRSEGSGRKEYAFFENPEGLAVMHYYNLDKKRIPRGEYLEEGFVLRSRLIDLQSFRPARVPEDLVAVLGAAFSDDLFNRWLEDIGILDKEQPE